MGRQIVDSDLGILTFVLYLCTGVTGAQMKIIVSSILFIVSVIHLLPVVGVLGSDSLTRLYGITVSDSNTEILLRHRAVLFAIIGLFLLLSVVKSEYQPIAICIGLISVASFLLLTWSIEGLNSEISRVAKVDWVALVLLIVAGVINILI
jgi:hypothetical protein